MLDWWPVIPQPWLWRIGTDGTYDAIGVPAGMQAPANLITNADQGVVVTWANCEVINNACVETGAMAVTTGTSVSVFNGPSVPSQDAAVVPVLQAQDGSFVGTVSTDSGQQMVAFDASGTVRWAVPNEQPQIATDDGGVIGQSGITYDENGNATGQVALYTQSWFGESFKIGSVDLVLSNPLYVATSFWPFWGANTSGNSTATQQPEYAQLRSCPGAATPCPQEAMMSALSALRTLLKSPCQTCFDWVFNKLPGTSQADFLDYISRSPRFWDGTRSYVAANNALCATDLQHYYGFFCTMGSSSVRSRLGTSEAMSQTPSNTGKGMQVFFNPTTGICNVFSSPNPPVYDQGTLNQAELFHEALHGYTGHDDNYLETHFGLPATFGESSSITNYLQGKAIPGGAYGASACTN